MQVSFKAHLLNTPTIYKRNCHDFDLKQKARFLEIDINSEEDYEAIKSIAFSWDKGSSFACDLFDMLAVQKLSSLSIMFPNYRYFALTNRDDNILKPESILAVASLRKENEDTFMLQHLQVKPEHVYGSNDREYKHIGKAVLGSIIDMLPKNNIKLYPFTHEAELFYKKFDFKKLPNSFYMIRRFKL